MGHTRKNKKPKSKKAKLEHVPQQRDVDPQSSSVLFRLPPKLRNDVYTILFGSTRLTFGLRSLGRLESQKMKPAANSLAILRSCRRIYEEAKEMWLGNVLFNFEHTEDLMDKLSSLPRTTLSAIRHVRTSARPVMMTIPGDDDDVFYKVPHVLKLLPGLRLDSLTVLDDTGPEVAYQTMDFFVNYGHGWKELRFITRTSEVFAFKARPDPFGPPLFQRKPQPQAWNEAILRRDGGDSRASVVIHRSMRLESGSVLKPSTRQRFNQNVTSPSELQRFGRNADLELLSDSEKRKELLIIVKRGCSADISNVGMVHDDGFDPREWSYGLSWAHIRMTCMSSRDRLSQSVEADIYDDPDEYRFPSYLYS